MALVGNLVINLLAKTGMFDAGMKKSQKTVSEFGTHIQKLSNRITGLFSAVVLYRGITSLIRHVRNLVSECVAAAGKMQKMENLFEFTFGKKLAGATRAWTERLADYLGYPSDSIRAMTAEYDILFKTIGIADDKAAEMSKTMTRLTYDMAAMRQEAPEDIFSTLSAGITGATRGLKRYGIIIKDDVTKAVKELKGTKDYYYSPLGEKITAKDTSGEVDEATEAMIRYNEILKNTGQYSDAARKNANLYENTMYRLRLQIESLRDTIGKKLIPVFTEFAGQLADWITKNKTKIADLIGYLFNKLYEWVGSFGSTQTIFDKMTKWLDEIIAKIPKLDMALRGVKPALDNIADSLGKIYDHMSNIGNIFDKIITYTGMKGAAQIGTYLGKNVGLPVANSLMESVAESRINALNQPLPRDIPNYQPEMGSLRETNSWLRKIAERLTGGAARLGGPAPAKVGDLQ